MLLFEMKNKDAYMWKTKNVSNHLAQQAHRESKSEKLSTAALGWAVKAKSVRHPGCQEPRRHVGAKINEHERQTSETWRESGFLKPSLQEGLWSQGFVATGRGTEVWKDAHDSLQKS